MSKVYSENNKYLTVLDDEIKKPDSQRTMDIVNSVDIIFDIDPNILLNKYKAIIDNNFIELMEYNLQKESKELTDFIYDNFIKSDDEILKQELLEELCYNYCRHSHVTDYLIDKGITLPDNFIEKLFYNYPKKDDWDMSILDYLSEKKIDLTDQIKKLSTYNNYRFTSDINKIISYRQLYGLPTCKIELINETRKFSFVLIPSFILGLIIIISAYITVVLSNNNVIILLGGALLTFIFMITFAGVIRYIHKKYLDQRQKSNIV